LTTNICLILSWAPAILFGKKRIMKIRILYPLIVITFLISCKKDKLSIPRTPCTSTQLRLDGYYYEKYGTPERWKVFFFYRDGAVFGGFTFLATERLNVERELIDGSYSTNVKNEVSFWGLFKIDNTKIEFEKWYPVFGGTTQAYVFAGNILNDTTFIIEESYNMERNKKKDYRKENSTFHFRFLNPKPDSTNNVLK